MTKHTNTHDLAGDDYTDIPGMERLIDTMISELMRALLTDQKIVIYI